MTMIKSDYYGLRPAEPGWRAQVTAWAPSDIRKVNDAGDVEVVTLASYAVPIAYWAREHETGEIVPAVYKLGPSYEAVLVPAWDLITPPLPEGAHVESVLRAPGEGDLDLSAVLGLPTTVEPRTRSSMRH